MMEYCLNKNLDDIKIKDLNEINDFGVDGEGGEIKYTENEYVIHRYITEN